MDGAVESGTESGLMDRVSYLHDFVLMIVE